MCPYRNTKALCCPTEYFLPDEADQNRPLISETAGVINCVFIFRGGREHGTKFRTYEDLGAQPIKRGQRRANQGTKKNKLRYDEMCVCVHYDTLQPICFLCVSALTMSYWISRCKTVWFTRSHAASAQRPVNTIQFIITVLIRVSHTESTSYVCTHTTSIWKLCLLVCKMLFLQKFLPWGEYDITAALARKVTQRKWCNVHGVWLAGSVLQYQLVWGAQKAIHKREKESERHKAQLSCDPYGRNTVSLHDSFPSSALTSVTHTHHGHSNKLLRASKNTWRDTNTQTRAEAVRPSQKSSATSE